MVLLKSVELTRGRGVPTGKFKNTYRCDWCLLVFDKSPIRKISGGGKHCLSDQVKCPRCENFIKTWK
jgi:rubredoxin